MVEDDNKVVTVNDSDNQQAEAVPGELGVVGVADNAEQVEDDTLDEGGQVSNESAHGEGDVEQGTARNVSDPSSNTAKTQVQQTRPIPTRRQMPLRRGLRR